MCSEKAFDFTLLTYFLILISLILSLQVKIAKIKNVADVKKKLFQFSPFFANNAKKSSLEIMIFYIYIAAQDYV